MFIKICGITSVADARMAAGCGIQAIGLNFYPGSPRFVQPELGQQIINALPTFVDPVGVFVSMTAAEIRQVAQSLGLRTLQVHGRFDPALVANLREFSVMPAFPLRDPASAAEVTEFLDACRELGRLPSAVLVDGFEEGKLGGTGRTAHWPAARQVVERSGVPVVLAGGLTAKNVADAIRTVGPWGVDVASGVEVAPGRKESFKVRSFVESARRRPGSR